MDKFQNTGFNKILNEVRYRQIKPYFIGTKCCEVGCGEGQLTKYLVEDFDEVLVIDKEQTFLDNIPNYKNIIKMVHDIEEESFKGCYDTIICTNVLEHLENPQQAINNIKQLGNKSSIFIFVTPNGESLNRKIGARLGFIKSPLCLDVAEQLYGHKHSFNLATLTNRIVQEKFMPIISKTYFYKPYPNILMEKLPNYIIENCEKIDTDSYGAELLVVGRLRNIIKENKE